LDPFVSASSSRLTLARPATLLPLRGAARDLRLGSGLTANRKNLPNASELYPAFDLASRSPRPALCYRPLPALLLNLAIKKVTRLEPRTPHQPEKLKKLSKNDCLCNSFAFFSQYKIAACNRVYFQSSAGRSQVGDQNWCSSALHFPSDSLSGAALRGFQIGNDRSFLFLRAACGL
jgi:hypothetical protein